MANSLRAKLSKLRHDRHITDEEYQELISKLDGHDKQVKADAIEEFAKLLKEKADEDASRFNIYTFTCIDEVAEQLKEQK